MSVGDHRLSFSGAVLRHDRCNEPRTAAQLVRLFERSRASSAKLAQSSDGSLECVPRAASKPGRIARLPDREGRESVSTGWHPTASPPMGSNVQSMRRDMGKSPQDAWYYPCRRRPGEAKLGSWISPARARERADHIGEPADLTTAHIVSASGVRSTA